MKLWHGPRWSAWGSRAAGCPPTRGCSPGRAPQAHRKAMSFGQDTGLPVASPSWSGSSPSSRASSSAPRNGSTSTRSCAAEAEERGAPLYEYRIPFGANLTIEVTGEPQLTRTYSVPPTGFRPLPLPDEAQDRGTDGGRAQGPPPARARGLPQEAGSADPHQHDPVPAPNTQNFYQQSFGGADIMVMGVAQTRYFFNVAFTGKGIAGQRARQHHASREYGVAADPGHPPGRQGAASQEPGHRLRPSGTTSPRGTCARTSRSRPATSFCPAALERGRPVLGGLELRQADHQRRCSSWISSATASRRAGR